MNYYILYNPKAGHGRGAEVAETLKNEMGNSVLHMVDVTKVTNYSALLSEHPDCGLILCGGDGTLNHFVNDTADLNLPNEVFYFAVGTGNDFLRDICGEHKTDAPVCITPYLKDLPICEINGKKYRFLNGIGYGIDGYCCEEGDRQRDAGKKKINYTGIAIKGLLYDYKPTNATVTIDGVTTQYKKVWLAPTMHGRFFGGGMMPTPDQNRDNPDHSVSIMVFNKLGKLRTLMLFPSLFKGEHVNKSADVHIMTGHEVTVEFDRPAPLQVDGETIRNVKKYHVYPSAKITAAPKEAVAAAEKM